MRPSLAILVLCLSASSVHALDLVRDGQPVAVIVEAPPPAPARLTAVAYDNQTQQLTLQIS
jgi:hypothetical protein